LDALNIRNLGKKFIYQLVNPNLVHHYAELYELQPEIISQLKNFQQKAIQRLYQSIQASKNHSLDRFIYALGIRGVGRKERNGWLIILVL